MRRSIPLLLLAGAALAGCEQVLTKQAEYRPQEAGSIDQALCLLGFTGIALQELVTGHQVVEARLNGRPATFVVDTGANVSVLNAARAG